MRNRGPARRVLAVAVVVLAAVSQVGSAGLGEDGGGAVSGSGAGRERKAPASKRAGRPAAPRPGSRDVEEARRRQANQKRWHDLDTKKRQEILKIARLVQKLPAQKREALIRKLRSMSPEERRTSIRRAAHELGASPEERQAASYRKNLLQRAWTALSPAEREHLKSLSPEERARYLARTKQKRREAMIASLPPDVRDRVQGVPLREQARLLRDYRTQVLVEKTFRNTRELERLGRLRPSALVEALPVAIPPGGSRPGARSGHEGASEPSHPRPPKGVSGDTWKRWCALKPFERQRILAYLRDKAQAAPRSREMPDGQRAAPSSRQK